MQHGELPMYRVVGSVRCAFRAYKFPIEFCHGNGIVLHLSAHLHMCLADFVQTLYRCLIVVRHWPND